MNHNAFKACENRFRVYVCDNKQLAARCEVSTSWTCLFILIIDLQLSQLN